MPLVPVTLAGAAVRLEPLTRGHDAGLLPHLREEWPAVRGRLEEMPSGAVPR